MTHHEQIAHINNHTYSKVSVKLGLSSKLVKVGQKIRLQYCNVLRHP